MDFDASQLNPTLPNVRLLIGGERRALAFDYRAIVAAEKLTGQNLLSGTWSASFMTLGGLLYAALLPGDPKLEFDTVSGWIHFGNAPVIYEAILKAWTGSLPIAGAQGEAEAQAAPPDAA